VKCGAGERWRRAVGPILREIKKYYIRVKEERNILHTIRKRTAKWSHLAWKLSSKTLY
jgi:hypothetical protein